MTAPTDPKTHSRQQVVLVLDDDPDILDALEAYLESQEFSCVPFSSGQIALEYLRERPVDAIVSDVRMPDMSGIDFLERVRAEDLHKGPFIFFSGFEAPKRLAEFQTQGDSPPQFVAKPAIDAVFGLLSKVSPSD